MKNRVDKIINSIISNHTFSDYIGIDIYEYFASSIEQGNSINGYLVDRADLEKGLRESVIKTTHSLEKLIELELIYKVNYDTPDNLEKLNIDECNLLNDSTKLYFETFDVIKLVSFFRLIFLLNRDNE